MKFLDGPITKKFAVAAILAITAVIFLFNPEKVIIVLLSITLIIVAYDQITFPKFIGIFAGFFTAILPSNLIYYGEIVLSMAILFLLITKPRSQ